MILVSLDLKDENFTYISIHFHVKGKKDQDDCLKVMDIFSEDIL